MVTKKYRVKIQGDDGAVSFQEFESREQAQELYDSLNGKAEIQRFVEVISDYETIVYPTFEF